MIHVDFDPSELTGDDKAWWDAWTKRATVATAAIVAKWEESKKIERADFESGVWSDLKSWLLKNVFHGKCAYCETHIGMSRQPGHAEHFRPKGGIKNRDPGKKKLLRATVQDETGQTINHPGYFWLAYCWKNLLPSCNDCNTGRGKNNQFPVRKKHVLVTNLSKSAVKKLKFEPIESPTWSRHYYLGPDDLDDEEGRLLLHPYEDEPRKHILFGFRGIEAPNQINGKPSEMGKQSIETYELDDDYLRRARQEAQTNSAGAFMVAYGSAVQLGKSPGEAEQAASQFLAQKLGNSPPYSAAIDDYLRSVKKQFGGS